MKNKICAKQILDLDLIKVFAPIWKALDEYDRAESLISDADYAWRSSMNNQLLQSLKITLDLLEIS